MFRLGVISRHLAPFLTARSMASKPTVTTIDCDYQNAPSAAFLIVENKQAAFIDNNTNYSVPILLKALQKEGLTPENVKFIIITHAHLDHAGGTGLLAQHCPNATVLAHPKAAPHMIDPSRLIQGVKAVYGDRYHSLYGDIQSVPRDRVRAMEDGSNILLSEGRELRFVHVRGHAKHHMIIHDVAGGNVFTGDAFGVSYIRECLDARIKTNPTLSKNILLFPSTSPVDFEPEEAIISLQKIKDTGAENFYLTHFGIWPAPVEEGIAQMEKGIRFHEQLMLSAMAKLRDGISSAELYDWVHPQLVEWFRLQFVERNLDPSKLEELHKLDVELNAQGIVAAAAFRVKK